MSLETPVQIDLANDDSWNQIDDSLLTPEDKQFLREQFNEESEGIIYLTQQELTELQTTIEATRDPRGEAEGTHIAGESFNAFIEEQVLEGLSLQDFFSGVEGVPEGLGNQIDTITQNTLFGSEGIMNEIDLSSTAKDNISMSLSLAAIQGLGNTEELTAENLQVKLQEFTDNLNSIKNIFSQTETTDEGDSPYASIVNISGQGELNTIFMNSIDGVAFFEGIISGTILENQIESYVEERNVEEGSQGLENQISEIQTMSQDSLETILSRLTPTSIETNTDTGALTIPEDPVERQTLVDRLSNGNMFEKILAAILEAFQGILPEGFLEESSTISRGVENTDLPSAEEIAPQRLTRIREFFSQNTNEGIFEGMDRSSILALFPESGELSETAQNIIRQIEAIPGEESLIDKMNNLFISKINLSDTDESAGQVPRITRFLHDMQEFTDTPITLKNADDTINPEKLLTAVNAYKSYRVENEAWKAIPENAAVNRNMTYREYFESNQTDTEE